MKTQIITLASHDDLISVRDRMSWAKVPRILLVWPAFEQVALRPLDLRILQKHASSLGAQLGLVTRRGEVWRNAESFGIPVFKSAQEAQRAAWPRHPGFSRRLARRRPQSAASLRELAEEQRGATTQDMAPQAIRISFFSLGVLAVLVIASLFVPRATIELRPLNEPQGISFGIEVLPATASGAHPGVLVPETTTITVSGTKSMSVSAETEVPITKAAGAAEFRNLTTSAVIIPAGTIVYALSPDFVRYVTLSELRLDGGAGKSDEVPIEAVSAGEAANVPANSVQGIEGHLSALLTVTNKEPILGGTSQPRSVPSQADRETLRTGLLQELEAQARASILESLESGDILLPRALELIAVDKQQFEPEESAPATVLSLSMTANYRGSYVRGADVRGIVQSALDGALPPGFAARADTLDIQAGASPSPDPDGAVELEVRATRVIARVIDSQEVNEAVRGKTQREASTQLSATLPLAEAPKITLVPRWWPWLPLIPFRIEILSG